SKLAALQPVSWC
ncbi:HDOD domain protein, partial [Vibrio parahaemolyticus VP2007-007]